MKRLRLRLELELAALALALAAAGGCGDDAPVPFDAPPADAAPPDAWACCENPETTGCVPPPLGPPSCCSDGDPRPFCD